MKHWPQHLHYRPPPPANEEEAARIYTELLHEALEKPDHKVCRKFSNGTEMALVVPRIPAQQDRRA